MVYTVVWVMIRSPMFFNGPEAFHQQSFFNEPFIPTSRSILHEGQWHYWVVSYSGREYLSCFNCSLGEAAEGQYYQSDYVGYRPGRSQGLQLVASTMKALDDKAITTSEEEVEASSSEDEIHELY